MSDKILVGLIFFYVIAFAVALAQNKYGLAVYWLGAGILSVGVLMGTR